MNILPLTANWKQVPCHHEGESKPGSVGRAFLCGLLAAGASAIFPTASLAQQTDPRSPWWCNRARPGRQAKRCRRRRGRVLPPRSVADVEFMQGMIHHHAQAVEMTAMIPSHTQNKELRSLGARISSSQSDEIKFMKRWLAARGESVPQAMPKMPGMDMSHERWHADARNADAATDGSAAKGEGRRV